MVLILETRVLEAAEFLQIPSGPRFAVKFPAPPHLPRAKRKLVFAPKQVLICECHGAHYLNYQVQKGIRGYEFRKPPSWRELRVIEMASSSGGPSLQGSVSISCKASAGMTQQFLR